MTSNKKFGIHIFLIFIYIISLVVDLYNGYVQTFYNTETIIPIIYKGGILLYCMCFILKNKTVFKYAYLFLICYLCCILYWIINGYSVTMMGLIDNLSKLIYPYVILAYFVSRGFVADNKGLLLRYMVYGSVLAASVIVLTSLLGVGINSYGEDYGYGSRGFFQAGNDISLLLILGNIITSYLFTVESRYIYILYGLIISAGCMLIGTTAGIIGTFANYMFLILQLLFVRCHYTGLYRALCIIILVIGAPLLINWTISIINTDAYTKDKFNTERLMSGGARGSLKEAYLRVRADFTIGDYLFGLGNQEVSSRMGKEVGVATGRVIELNQYEMTGYYGFILGGIILLVPIIFLIQYMRDFIKRRGPFSYWMSIAFGLFVSHGLTAGHAYNNIQAMIMLVGLIYLYKYKAELNYYI